MSSLARGCDALQATPPPPPHGTSIKEQKAKQKTGQQVMQWNLGLHNMRGFRETSVTWAQHVAFRLAGGVAMKRGLLHHFIKPHSNCNCCTPSCGARKPTAPTRGKCLFQRQQRSFFSVCNTSPLPFVLFLLPGLNLGRTNCLRRATLVLLAGLLSTA